MAFKDFAKGFGGFFAAFSPARVVASGKYGASRALHTLQNAESRVFKTKDPLPKEVVSPPDPRVGLPTVGVDFQDGRFDETLDAPIATPAWARVPASQPITVLPDAPPIDMIDRMPIVAVPAAQPPSIPKVIAISVARDTGTAVPIPSPVSPQPNTQTPPVQTVPVRIQPYTGVSVFGKNTLIP